MKLREQALNLLARREYSRAELRNKLSQKFARRVRAEARDEADAADDVVEQVEALLDDLERERLLSNTRFAESMANARLGKHGSLRVRADLQAKGVPDAVTQVVLVDARASDLQGARQVWCKKFGHPPADAAERARQMRFLASRGFPAEVVRQVLAGLGAVDDE